MKVRAKLAALAIAVTAIGGHGGVAHASPHREHAWVTADAHQPRVERSVDDVAPDRARAAFAPLVAGGWRALWDRETGVALRVWGAHVDAPGATADGAIAEAALRRFLAAHVDVLAPGASAADFVVVANHVEGALRTVGLAQRWHGLPVVGGYVSGTFERDRLFVVGSEAIPDLAPLLVSVVNAKASDATVRAAAEAWIARAVGHRAVARPAITRVVVPIIHPLTAAGARDIEARVASQIVVDAVGAAGQWDVFVDDAGTPLARRSRIADGTGTLTYNAALRYPLSTRIDYPAGDVDLTVDGLPATAAIDGTFTWSSADDPVSVVTSCGGDLVEVITLAGSAATTTLSVPDGGSGEWSLANDEYGDAQLAAYVHVMVAKAHTHVVNPGIDAWTNLPLDAYVNEDDTCNAYSTGQDIHFYRADAMCENTGRLADIVFHEYGHSQHFNSIIPGAGEFNTPLSEGLADFNACDINDDTAMGRGFYYTDDPLRDIDPPGTPRVYPQDLSDDPHVSGEIISGALWDLRTLASAQLGSAAGVALAQNIFLGVMQRAADIPSSYVAALTIDDDDGDLGNGTPHECLIERAFGPHGLAGSDFVNTVVGLPQVSGSTITVAVTTPSDPSCPPPNVTGIAIDWQVGDGVHSTVAFTTADGATWTAAIPTQPDDTVVTYTVTATFDNGETLAYPNNPADPRYQMFFGAVTPIWCDDFTAAPGWAQTSSFGSEWQWGAPGQMPTSDDPLTAYSGSDVYGMDLVQGAYDASDTTSTTTPTIDVSSFAEVRLQYRRWLTVEDALYDHATISVNGTQIWENAMSIGGTLDHVDKEWRFHDLDLTPLLAAGSGTSNAVAVTWGLTSDDSVQLGGWILDDVCIVGRGKYPKCGDGVLDPGEQCDDGNLVAGDGCSPTCTIEPATVGGGGCAAGGGEGDGDGDPGNRALPSLVLATLAMLLARRKSR